MQLFASAAFASVHDHVRNQLATQHLLSALAESSCPLAGLQIQPSTGIHIGELPPWHEDPSTNKLDTAYASAKGFKPFSFHLDRCLQEATMLAKTTGGFLSVNSWHIAFSLIKLNPPGFSHKLQTGSATLEQAVKILRENARKSSPGIYRVLPWRSLERAGISLSPMPRLAEEDRNTLRLLLTEMGIEPSFAVGNALNYAVAQCAQVANVIGSSQVRIEHLIAGLLTVGTKDESEDSCGQVPPSGNASCIKSYGGFNMATMGSSSADRWQRIGKLRVDFLL